MDVSPNALRKEVVQTLKSIQHGLDIPQTNVSMATLLLAKAQCLHTLAILNEGKTKERSIRNVRELDR